jgi:hypothetical protein
VYAKRGVGCWIGGILIKMEKALPLTALLEYPMRSLLKYLAAALSRNSLKRNPESTII